MRFGNLSKLSGRWLLTLLPIHYGVLGCSSTGPAVTYCESFDVRSAQIAVVGDTQRTMRFERWFLGREQNDGERQPLVAAIAAERPDLLIHLGDAVADGGSARQWAEFDRLMEPVTCAAIPVLPVVGNHEYWGVFPGPIPHFDERFPETAKCHWHSARFGPLQLVWLDSNEAVLSKDAWRAQQAWFADEVKRVDADPTIRGVIVFCHHPPFTNSRATGDEHAVKDAFMPAILGSTKTLALATGHAHAYEHFIVSGKHLIVSGGGGGPRVKLLTGESARHVDQFTGPSPRPFHFLLLTVQEDGVQVEVKGFEKGQSQPTCFDRFRMDYPAKSPAMSRAVPEHP